MTLILSGIESLHQTRGETVELLDELVTWWRNRDGGSVTLDVRGHQAVALVMWGLTTHAVNLAAAIVTLHRAGERAAMPALARQVIELGTTAVWVELCGGRAAEALMAEHNRQQLNELDEFMKIGMTGGDTARAAVAAETAWFLAHPSGRYFEKRCRELEGGNAIYAVYRAESEYSHASTAVVDNYLRDPRPGSEAPVGIEYQPREDTRPSVVVALTMLVHCCLAFDRLDRDHQGRSRLREVAREIGVTHRIELSPAGSRAQRTRGRADRARRRIAGGSRRAP